MLDIKLIRENPDSVRQALKNRHSDESIDDIIELDKEHAKMLFESETLKARRNKVSKDIGRTQQKPPELIEEMKQVSDKIKAIDKQAIEVEKKLNVKMLCLPNIPHSSVPVGDENIIIRQWSPEEGYNSDFDIDDKLDGMLNDLKLLGEICSLLIEILTPDEQLQFYI